MPDGILHFHVRDQPQTLDQQVEQDGDTDISEELADRACGVLKEDTNFTNLHE
jgi:hypothetical protein